mmetsp:Transcript_413/g.1498  ORF Transcript_413/g.1498 Transcript_413/m.1498 type:complete len:228 (+) Transcript_413:2816-3499(+)
MPSLASAACLACSCAKVTNPAPLHRPVAGLRMSRTRPSISPNREKTSATSCSSLVCGRYLTNTSYPSASDPCAGALAAEPASVRSFVPVVRSFVGLPTPTGALPPGIWVPPATPSALGALHRKQLDLLAKLVDPHGHCQSFWPVSFLDALPAGGFPKGSSSGVDTPAGSDDRRSWAASSHPWDLERARGGAGACASSSRSRPSCTMFLTSCTAGATVGPLTVQMPLA